MYRTYRRSIRDSSISNGLSRRRYFRPPLHRNRHRVPWYTYPRRRPTIYDRDRRFRDWLRERLRERERINREEDNEDSEEEDDKPEVPGTDLSRKLHVTNLDLHINENTQKHHTDMYECTEDSYGNPAQLVIRRGQAFQMSIRFDRPYNIRKNDITLLFSLVVGEGRSSVSETCKVTESKDTSYRPRNWGASVIRNDSNSLTLEVFAPASTPIGEWELSIKTIVDVDNGKDLIWQYNHNEEIIIIFNPWCKEDTVYMSDQTWLEECIFNDSGTVFWGNYRQIGTSQWYYGQFEDTILQAALHLLRRGFGFKATKAMGNAPRVARVLSTIVNSNDDNGVLVGNWSDDYSGGVPPASWAGSVKILKQYMKTAKPVKYAQCWVYSHVLTTVCRALGMPCRSLTNFESAHNTDKDHLSYDLYYTQIDDQLVETPSSDSIWNFHVWNEVWMSRPDLGRDFDGWQVIDATPQERSDGVFCCGPASLFAIKEGLINVAVDTAFVFAEVNSDKVRWKVDRTTGNKTILDRIPDAVGKNISTRSPTGGRLDITDLYKYKEGTQREREIVRKAERMFRNDNLDSLDEETPPQKPVELMIEEMDNIYVGSDFEVEVVVTNSNNTPCTINLTIKVSSRPYFGASSGNIASTTFRNEILGPREHRAFKLPVSAREALVRPRDGFNFHIEAVAKVKESNSEVMETSSFRFRRPDIQIQGPDSVRIGEEYDVTISFKNPLSTGMTNCKVEIDGSMKVAPGSPDYLFKNLIYAGDTWTQTIRMTPARAPRNNRHRGASFTLESNQMLGIVGSYYTTLIG